ARLGDGPRREPERTAPRRRLALKAKPPPGARLPSAASPAAPVVAPPRSAASLLAAMVAVVVALFFAWRPQLDFFLRFDDVPLRRAAQEGPSLDHLRDHAVGYFDAGSKEPLWQPGVHELADVTGSFAQGDSRRWLAIGLIVHAVVTLVL